MSKERLLNQQDKQIKELEQQLNKDFTLREYIRLEQENQQLKEQLEIFKKVNDALRQDNLDLSYDKVDMAYEYAKEMAENWENDYQEEIQQLKQQLTEAEKQLANSKLEMLHDIFCSTINNRMLQNYVCSIIRMEIEELKNDGKL